MESRKRYKRRQEARKKQNRMKDGRKEGEKEAWKKGKLNNSGQSIPVTPVNRARLS